VAVSREHGNFRTASRGWQWKVGRLPPTPPPIRSSVLCHAAGVELLPMPVPVLLGGSSLNGVSRCIFSADSYFRFIG
jgi:hypothetical protein